MDKLREPGRLTAERVHGIKGAVDNHTGFTVHTENNPFGMTAPTNAQEYGWNPTGAAWAVQNLWWHYEFTQDEAYLKNYYLSDHERGGTILGLLSLDVRIPENQRRNFALSR